MTVGKGIGGGMAVSAVVGRERFMGHWAAGRPHLDVHGQRRQPRRRPRRDRRLPTRAIGRPLGRARADRFSSGSHVALAGTPHVGEVRGLGLFIGIEIVSDRATREPDPARARAIRRTAFEHGVLLGGGGHEENVIKICPPLTIDAALLDTAVDLTIDAIKGNR